jgi:cytochrome c5
MLPRLRALSLMGALALAGVFGPACDDAARSDDRAAAKSEPPKPPGAKDEGGEVPKSEGVADVDGDDEPDDGASEGEDDAPDANAESDAPPHEDPPEDPDSDEKEDPDPPDPKPDPKPDAKRDPPKKDPPKQDDPAPASGADGAELYKKKCKNCHGVKGDADTKIGQKHDIPSWKDAGWKGKWPVSKVKDIVTNGKAGTKMKAFKGKLTPEEIDAVSKYARGLAA